MSDRKNKFIFYDGRYKDDIFKPVLEYFIKANKLAKIRIQADDQRLKKQDICKNCLNVVPKKEVEKKSKLYKLSTDSEDKKSFSFIQHSSGFGTSNFKSSTTKRRFPPEMQQQKIKIGYEDIIHKKRYISNFEV